MKLTSAPTFRTQPRLAGERRRHPRTALARPAAVRHPHRNQTLQAKTVDLSPGGCRLILDAAPLIEPGQILKIAIATLPGSGIVRPQDFVEARVIRRVRRGIRQQIAVSYITVRPLAAAS